MAPNTLQTYNTALGTFKVFRRGAKLPDQWPVNFNHIALFVANCFETGLTAKTVKTYIAGINYFHKLQGGSDITDHFLIKKLLEGFSRSAQSKDDRAPLTFNLLLRIVSQLPKICYSSYETTLFQTIWVLAYFGLFRVSELVATTGQRTSQILFDHAHVDPAGRFLDITLGRHKNHQSNIPFTIRIPAAPNAKLCPVQSMLKFLAVRSRKAGPLFCHANNRPVSRFQFAALLGKCVAAAGLTETKIRTHSFRMGRATDLAAQSVPAPVIMKLGRWSSNAYKSYIR